MQNQSLNNLHLNIVQYLLHILVILTNQLHNARLQHAFEVNSMSDETDSDEDANGLLSENNDDDHLKDIVMEVDMNSGCNVSVNYNESESYQCWIYDKNPRDLAHAFL